MNHKEILTCCVDVLESFRYAKVSADEHIETYLQEIDAIDADEALFISEVFHGCVHYRRIISCVLKEFYQRDGDNCLSCDETLFKVLLYIAVFRLDEIGFSQFAKFLTRWPTRQFFRLLRFLFNENNLKVILTSAWERHYDTTYVSETLVAPLLSWIPKAEQLIDHLHSNISVGMRTEKHHQQPTEPIPFKLTRPRFRSIPLPEPVPHVTKPRSVPRTTYERPHEEEVISLVKEENHRRVQEKYHRSSNSQFACADHQKSEGTLASMQRIRDEQTSLLQFDKPKARPLPKSVIEPFAPIKLNAAAILREEAVFRRRMEEESRFLAECEMGMHDASGFEEWQEERRLQEEQEKIDAIERRHLEGLLSREEAILAKEAVTQRQRIIVDNMKEESRSLRAKAQRRLEERDRANRRRVEEAIVCHENAKEATQKIRRTKRRAANELNVAKAERRMQVHEERKRETEAKADLIRQIRALEAVPPSKLKMVDLSESSGVGLLAEMSVVELRERLVMVRIRNHEEEEERRAEITKSRHNKEVMLAKKVGTIIAQRDYRSRTTKLTADRKKQFQLDHNNVVSPNPQVTELANRLEQLRTERTRLQHSSKGKSLSGKMKLMTSKEVPA